MSGDEAEAAPVPAQWQPQTLYDFRHQAHGPRGYKVNMAKTGNMGSKRKLDEYEEQVRVSRCSPHAAPWLPLPWPTAPLLPLQVERDQHEIAMRDDDDAPAPVQPAKRLKSNTTGVAKVSGRSWKPAEARSGTTKPASLSSSWEKKMQIKAELAARRDRKREGAEARKEAAKEERERRAAVKRRKEENQRKSVVAQRVTTATAQRMAKNKKLKKKLVTM